MPDTCACVLEYTYDADLPDDQREHTPTTVTPCERHAHGETELEFLAAHTDNVVKNNTHRLLKEEFPDMEDSDFEWDFDHPDGQLRYNVKGRTVSAAAHARVTGQVPGVVRRGN